MKMMMIIETNHIDQLTNFLKYRRYIYIKMHHERCIRVRIMGGT